MTDTEILYAAMTKADPGGMEATDWNHADVHELIGNGRHYSTIFSHDFAKAFWGENRQSFKDGEYMDSVGDMRELVCITENWKFHLMQMVLEENPIQYLSQFLK